MPFGLQPLDLIVIVVVALVIFGPKRLPQLGRWLGKTFSSFRKGARDLADGFTEETRARDATETGANPDGTGANAAGTGIDATAPRSPPESAPGPASAGTGTEPRPAGITCTSCGASNPADARFCNKCGIRLIA